MACRASIEAGNTNQILMRNYFVRGAVEMVLGRRLVAPPEAVASLRLLHAYRGATPIVVSCYICRDQMQKQKKTTKAV